MHSTKKYEYVYDGNNVKDGIEEAILFYCDNIPHGTAIGATVKIGFGTGNFFVYVSED